MPNPWSPKRIKALAARHGGPEGLHRAMFVLHGEAPSLRTIARWLSPADPKPPADWAVRLERLEADLSSH